MTLSLATCISQNLLAQDQPSQGSVQPQTVASYSASERNEMARSYLAESEARGRAEKGKYVFANAKAACASCHQIDGAGGIIGPELMSMAKTRTPLQIASSLLWPEQEIDPKYQPYQLLLDDDSVVTGYLVEPSEGGVGSGLNTSTQPIQIRNPATGEITEVDPESIVAEKAGSSLMPSGLVQSLPKQQQWDLLKFLLELPKLDETERNLVKSTIANASHHGVKTFTYDAKPLDPATRPLHNEHVNRDRIYDFYAKQANAFRDIDTGLEHLESIKALDDGKFGHWGNQDEETWRGDDWKRMKFNRVHGTVFTHEGKTVPRGLCFRMGDENEYSACFDPDTGGVVALWTGGFIQYSSIRHGFLDAARIVGESLEVPAEWKGMPVDLRQYLEEIGVDTSKSIGRFYVGYHEYGEGVTFLYRVNDRVFSQRFEETGPKDPAPNFVRACSQLACSEVGPVSNYLDPFPTSRLSSRRSENAKKQDKVGEEAAVPPLRWPEKIQTRIHFGSGKGFAVDTIELPTENPWSSPIFCSAHAFLPNGSALVATMHGDVFRVDHISLNPDQIGKVLDTSLLNAGNHHATWTKIASGLHHPLGIWVDDDGIFVQCRDQITRLIDLDNDNEIDFYECFSNAFVTSAGGHDYICGLVRDSQGYFYTASGNQGVVQISPDGKEAKVIATGFRNPDGIGILPGDILTVPTSEGDWTPASMVHWLPIDRSSSEPLPKHFGYGGPKVGGPKVGGPKDGLKTEYPFLSLPRYIDNSSGGQLFVSDARMGPLHNRILHTSFGTGTTILVLKDEVNGIAQGAAIVLPGDFQSGIHRAAINPVDGQVYLSGMTGWGTYTPKPGCFERLRYTGAPLCLPSSFHVRKNGVEIRFSEPIDASIASQARKQFAQCWNYRYAPAYGSPEYSVTSPGTVGHDRLEVESVHLDNDGMGLFLEIPELQRCNVLHLSLLLNSEAPIEIFISVNELDAPRSDVPSFAWMDHKELLPHPLDRDIEQLGKQSQNRWRQPHEGSRKVTIEAADNLQFAQKRFHAKAGEWIELTFINPDVVPHNWALFQPNSLDRVGEAVNRMITDPDAYLNQYVPKMEDVVCFTDIVGPKEQFVITFQVPDKPGIYPYLCTFPGHWMVMNGEMIVE